MIKTCPEIDMKLYSFGINNLVDKFFPHGLHFGLVVGLFKGFKPPEKLLKKPLENGFLFYLGLYYFNYIFRLGLTFKHLNHEEKFRFLSLLCEWLLFHDKENKSLYFKETTRIISYLNDLFKNDEERFYKIESRISRRNIQDNLFERFLNEHSNDLDRFQHLYAASFGERIFHDREMCAFIAKELASTSFSFDMTVKQDYYDRVNIPSWVKKSVISRDRGKCSKCDINIVGELLAEAHIDHSSP